MRKKIVVCLVVVILVLMAIFSAYGWFLKKQARVLSGTARPDFPFSDYSPAQLEALYSQNPENLAPTIQTPEETHQKFLAALKKEDFDEAVDCCFREGDKVGMKEFLIGVKNKGLLPVMMNDIKEIHKDTENSWEATYVYAGTSKGKKVGNIMEFIKTTSGIWYIKSL
ncbi:MAG: hypothetical protein WCT11_02115 [Candidatus Magasanikbacteria bacterium]|jgi:hypothetical protein